MTTRRRFYAPPSSFEHEGKSVILPPEEARHLRDVLRLAPGNPAFVFDGEGNEYECSITDVRRDYARLAVVSKVSPKSPESALKLTLAVSLLKGDKFDLVVQKATELGVQAILPIETRYADIRLKDDRDGERRRARWQRIALEAAKQSGRATVPKVSGPSDLAELFERNIIGDETRFMFAERLGDSFAEAIRGIATPKSVVALVGSEGGWAVEELQQARHSEWRIVTLGGRTLRAETAAITVTALLQHRFGDLK